MAARYQIAMSAITMTATGAALPDHRRTNVERERGIASLVIGMAGPQALPDPVGDLQKFRRLPDVERTVAREIAGNDVENFSRTRRHHHDPGRQEHGLRDRV